MHEPLGAYARYFVFLAPFVKLASGRVDPRACLDYAVSPNELHLAQAMRCALGEEVSNPGGCTPPAEAQPSSTARRARSLGGTLSADRWAEGRPGPLLATCPKCGTEERLRASQPPLLAAGRRLGAARRRTRGPIGARPQGAIRSQGVPARSNRHGSPAQCPSETAPLRRLAGSFTNAPLRSRRHLELEALDGRVRTERCRSQVGTGWFWAQMPETELRRRSSVLRIHAT
jgi:hypothetical protein